MSSACFRRKDGIAAAAARSEIGSCIPFAYDAGEVQLTSGIEGRSAGNWRKAAARRVSTWGLKQAPWSLQDARTTGTSALRVVYAGDFMSARIRHSRLNPCTAGTAVTGRSGR